MSGYLPMSLSSLASPPPFQKLLDPPLSRTEVIIILFLRGVYLLKNPSNAYLDNGCSVLNFINLLLSSTACLSYRRVLTTVTLLHSQITCDMLKENQPFLHKSNFFH